MEIEDLIDSKSRLEQGIFFTKHHIVDIINSNFDFTNIKTVIDSAAGSCNFLIPLAKKYPGITFYGIEKNSTIFNSVKKLVKNIPNIKYFNGDAILDSFDIPKCDLYIGNPPFINYSDLPVEYRESIKDIWLSYFPKSKGFKMLLGDSRGDISQLIFYITIDKYLNENGEIGVILPDSLIKGNSASAGFRDFTNITVKSLNDISNLSPFDNTCRNCFYLLGKKGGETTYPIIYKKGGAVVNLNRIGDDLIEDGFSILKTSPYIARQGVNTLGANSIFIFKKDTPFDSALIKPLLKSSDINPFNYSPSYKILFPYDEKGKIIPEEELKSTHSNVYNYLSSNKGILENRKSRFVKKFWYGLFGVGEYTCSKYKVVWRGLGAKELMAAVTSDIIPNQAMNCYISTDNLDEANYICGVMNSNIYKKHLSMLNETGAKSFAQPSTINKIFIPKFDSENRDHQEVSKLASSLKDTEVRDLTLLNRTVEQIYSATL